MLTCKEFDNFMVDYLDGTLPPLRRLNCWLHTVMCQECARFVREYRQTIALGQQACSGDDDEVPETVPEELVKAALKHRQTKLNQGESRNSETK